MNEDELNHKLRKIIAIASGTKTKKSAKSEDNKKQIARIANSLQELQLCVKYLLFDVEATKRERDKFKKILDEQTPN